MDEPGATCEATYMVVTAGPNRWLMPAPLRQRPGLRPCDRCGFAVSVVVLVNALFPTVYHIGDRQLSRQGVPGGAALTGRASGSHGDHVNETAASQSLTFGHGVRGDPATRFV
jgi:hypothetical protein